MFIIWLVSWSPGASAGTQITATAKARAATPTNRARSSPWTHSFSASTTAASTTMAARFVTPTTTNSAIATSSSRGSTPVVGAGAHIPQPTAVGAVVQLSGGRSFRKRRTVNPVMVPARYNFLYFSSRPALRAAASGGRPRPADRSQ
jgi:hypothetical protein